MAAEPIGSPMLYISAFFVTIATILGTGILGLPVTLANSGIAPFAATFAVCLVMQLSIVWLMVDLLQWTRVRLQYMARSDALAAAAAAGGGALEADAPRKAHGQTGPQQYNALMDAEGGEASEEAAGTAVVTSAAQGGETPPSTDPSAAAAGVVTDVSHAPDLHAMGKMFLGKTSRVIFDAAVMLHFLSVLVSYALAGSLAYAQLLGLISHLTLVIPVYIAVYCVLIFFGGKFVQSVISTFTFFKVTLLLFMIGVVGIVAERIDLPIQDDWGSSMEPFLLGTVALGGVVNIMPVVFSRIPFNASAMRRFRFAVTGGVVLCWMLNLLWAYFVLEIVPQTPALGEEAGIVHPELAGLDISLQRSREHGEISTVPVTEIINTGYPQYSWISLTVTIFIVLSVSVSFITIGTGMKHVLDGMVAQRARDKAAKADAATKVEIADAVPTDAPAATATAVATDAQQITDGVNNEEGAAASPQGVTDIAVDSDSGSDAGLAAEEDDEGLLGGAHDADVQEWSHERETRSCVRHAWADAKGALGALPCLQSQLGQRWALYVFWYGLVLIVALANPQGFLVVLEVFTSLALNLESGLFVGLMYYRAAKDNRVPFLAACGCALCFPSCGRRDRVRQAQNARLRRRRHSTAGDVVRTLEAKWDAVAARVKGGAGASKNNQHAEQSLMSQDVPAVDSAQVHVQVHVPTGGAASPDAPPSGHAAAQDDTATPQPPRAHVDTAVLQIPLPLHPFVGSWLMWFAVVTFLGACVFDVWTALAGLIGGHRTGWVFVGCLFSVWQVLALPRVVGPHSFTVYHSLRLRSSGEARPLLQPGSPTPATPAARGARGPRASETVSPRTRDVVLPCVSVGIVSLGMVFVVPSAVIADEDAGTYALAATLALVLVGAAVAAAVVRFATRRWRLAFFLTVGSALMCVGTTVAAGVDGNVAGAALFALGCLLLGWEALLHAQTLSMNAGMVARWQSPEGAAVWALRGSELAQVVDGVQGGEGGADAGAASKTYAEAAAP